jgi:zinc and cadmium transporter
MKALLVYSLVALGTTLFGSAVPMLKASWAAKHKWRLLAFSSGVLLAIAILHLFPEALALAGKSACLVILATFGILFLAENLTSMHAGEDFLHPGSLQLVPLTALVALTIHALVDGMAMGVSLRQNLAFGSAISIGVILHKFVDGLTRTSLLNTAHYYRFKEISLSVILAMATPAGALATYAGAAGLSNHAIGIVLGVSAGSFLYVGAADLLPRLHESNDRYNLVFFTAGMLVVGAFSI